MQSALRVSNHQHPELRTAELGLKGTGDDVGEICFDLLFPDGQVFRAEIDFQEAAGRFGFCGELEVPVRDDTGTSGQRFFQREPTGTA